MEAGADGHAISPPAGAVPPSHIRHVHLADPEIPGTARETWFSKRTALNTPVFFLILFVLLLGLATRPSWPGIIGIVGVTVLALISGMATLADSGMVQHIFANHLNIATVLSLALLFISIPATAILGTMSLVLQWCAQRAKHSP